MENGAGGSDPVLKKAAKRGMKTRFSAFFRAFRQGLQIPQGEYPCRISSSLTAVTAVILD